MVRRKLEITEDFVETLSQTITRKEYDIAELFLGACCGVALHSLEDNTVAILELVEDDGTWFIRSGEISSFWDSDYKRVTQAANDWISQNCEKSENGWKFKKERIYQKKSEKKALTCDEFVRLSISQYPTLWAQDNYTNSKISVLDHTLNVIGNGIRDDDDLEEKVIVPIKLKIPTEDELKKYFDEDIYYGHAEVEEIPIGEGETFTIGKGSFITVADSDRKNHPEILLWCISSKIPRELYPNFQKEYSLIYNAPSFFNLDKSWIEGAIQYYQYARKWILEVGDTEYAYAYPGQDPDRILEDFKNAFARYKSNEEISEAYGHPYNGNLVEFLLTRWDKEKARIICFIDETLQLLESKR